MSVAFMLMTLQALLGGIDNLWHHEITERLPARRGAAAELSLHARRELLYGLLFLGLAWFRWQGYWTLLIATVLLLEIAVTLADFLVEDRTRRLPPLERMLHTLLALNYGATLAVLAPPLLAWSRLPSGVQPTAHFFSWPFTVFAIGLIGWSLRNALAVLALRRPPEWVRNPIAAGSSSKARTVLISGATGFIGGHLVRHLVMRGDKVIVLTRNPDIALDRFGPHVRILTSLEQLEDSTRIDVIVNLAGAPILGLPWTRTRRRTLLASRLETTRALTSLMGRLTSPVRVFVSASAVGFYGIGAAELLDERSRPSGIFQSQLCQDWEAAARAAVRLGARLVRMRIGMVLGRDAGALPRLSRPVRLGLGAVLGGGAQWLSWIHVEDLVRLVEFAMDTPRVSGALNAVAPEPVTQRQFQHALARQMRRPLLLRVPAWLLRAALGEMAQLLVDGQRVVPMRAMTLGFEFRHRRIEAALRDLLGVADAEVLPARVYYNGDCPLCRTEMTHYAMLCAERQPQLQFIDSMRQPSELLDCGLRREHLERRVYLRRADGSILSGMPALLRLWSRIPRYRWLSRLLAAPVLSALANILYDHAVAPALAYWAQRRIVGRGPVRHGWF